MIIVDNPPPHAVARPARMAERRQLGTLIAHKIQTQWKGVFYSKKSAKLAPPSEDERGYFIPW